MKYPCPHCGRTKLLRENGIIICPTPGCGKWKTDKEFYESGFRAYYKAFTRALKEPRTYIDLDIADGLLHDAMRYLKEASK